MYKSGIIWYNIFIIIKQFTEVKVMVRNSNWIIDEYKKGNMADYDGKPIKPVEYISATKRAEIVELYECDEIYHLSDTRYTDDEMETLKMWYSSPQNEHADLPFEEWLIEVVKACEGVNLLRAYLRD